MRVLVLTLLLAFALPPDALASGIGVSAPIYESPGGTVPTIVTAYGVPAGYQARIGARGTGGAVAECRGAVWINRARRTASRKCYLHLPHHRGAFNVVGRARLTRPGRPMVIRAGSGPRAILANGYVSRGRLPVSRIEEIERCFNRTDLIWLTFDDGGAPSQVVRILDTLRRNRVRGRFFFTGTWAARYPKLLRRIRIDGHVVGNHSYSHAALSQQSASSVLSQLDRGTRPTTRPGLVRPPFAAGAFTARLQSLAATRGYKLCRWTVDTYDWQGPSAARMVERIRRGDDVTPPVEAGGNILMHGTAPHTSSGLQQIIDAVRAEGFALDRLPSKR